MEVLGVWPGAGVAHLALGGPGSIASTENQEKQRALTSVTFLLPVHRQQPARGQHAPQLWDPDDRDINRSPQLLSFIRGR